MAHFNLIQMYHEMCSNRNRISSDLSILLFISLPMNVHVVISKINPSIWLAVTTFAFICANVIHFDLLSVTKFHHFRINQQELNVITLRMDVFRLSERNVFICCTITCLF